MLIYLTAFGHEFLRHARMCITTLRHPRLGNFQGLIQVFTDVPDSPLLQGLPGNQVIRQWDLAPTRDRRYEMLVARVSAGLTLDHEQHDYIAYLDTDILASASLAPLFCVPDKLQYTIESVPLWTSPWSNAYLTDAEFNDANTRLTLAVNSGTFVAPGRMCKDLLLKWEAIMGADTGRAVTSNNMGPDQSALNALVLRGQVPAQPMPIQWIVQPVHGMKYPGARLFHFTSGRKENMKDRFHDLVRKTENRLCQR
jgi:hypothetical protein